MTTITIELPDSQAAALQAKATAQGLSLEGWFRKLADAEVPSQPISAAQGEARRSLERFAG